MLLVQEISSRFTQIKPISKQREIDGAHEVEKSLEEDSMIKDTLCDAIGMFEFTNISGGEWRIETTVQWYINNKPQGGTMREEVTVKSDERNKFIISR